ncbi:MAG: hypothetical protein EBZ48_02925 [Proteobacteria bacterium]|nr:hypothetical protein [Pseudomonadota bacterium]
MSRLCARRREKQRPERLLTASNKHPASADFCYLRCVGALALAALLVFLPHQSLADNNPAAGGGPGPANSRSLEAYAAEVRDKLIPQKKDQMRDVESKVKEVIEESQSQNSRWENWRGAESSQVIQTMMDDIEEITGESFSQCQYSDRRHSFEQIITPPYTTNSVYGCGTWYRTAAISSGIAIRCFPVGSPPFCPGQCSCACTMFDIVDYYFPTFKLDSSEQMYQSKYLDTRIVDGSIAPLNDQTIQSSAQLNKADMQTLRQTVVANMAGRNMPVRIGGTVPVDQTFLDAREDLKGNSELKDVLSTSPSQTNIYTRNIFELLNLASKNFWWLPHEPQYHWFGTDLPDGFPFSKHLSLSSILENKFTKLQGPGGAGSCVGHNIKTNKSPTGLGLFEPRDDNDLCLTKIGERFPLIESGRVSITDRTYRGIAKDLDLFYALVDGKGPSAGGGGGGMLRPTEAHTYKEKIDKLLVLRNEALKEEQSGCLSLPKIVNYNVEYRRANLKEIKKGGNNTHEVFTAFRGAWGLKGVPSGYFEQCGGNCKNLGFGCCGPCGCCPSGIIPMPGPGSNEGTADDLPWPSSNCFRTK